MTDITSSVKTLFTSDGSGGGLDPYVRKIDDMMELAGRAFGQGRLSGGAITIATGVVTIPAGTVLMVPMGVLGRKALVEIPAAIASTVEENHFLYASVSKDAKGQAVVDLSSAAAAPAGSLNLGQATGGPPPDTWADNAELDQQNPKRYYLSFSIQATNADVAFVPVPIGGRVKRCRTVVDTTIGTGALGLTFEIGGVAITAMAVAIADSAAEGDLDDSGEQANDATNDVAAGGAVEIVGDGGSDAGNVNGIIEIEPN